MILTRRMYHKAEHLLLLDAHFSLDLLAIVVQKANIRISLREEKRQFQVFVDLSEKRAVLRKECLAASNVDFERLGHVVKL